MQRHIHGVVRVGYSLCVIIAGGARADYVCRQVDVPGSSFTQVWGINNAGQFAATSDVGSFIYSAGAWIRQPLPPAGFSRAFALAINDFGVFAGGAFPAGSEPEQGFYFSDGAYHFFLGGSVAFPNTEGRGINNAGILSVRLTPLDGSNTGLGAIYNPGSSTLYPPGFTVIEPPALADGTRARHTRPGQMNTAGRVVGSALYPGHGSYGFIHDPDGSTTLFLVNGLETFARGVNDQGDIVGALTIEPVESVTIAFVRTSQGDQTFDCAMLNASGGVFPQSINNNGVITGGITDAVGTMHGFVAYPSAAAELADLLGAVEGVGPGRSLERKLRVAQQALSRGDTAATCASLRAFIAEVHAQSGRHIDSQVAASFTAEAESIASALACGS